MSESGIVSESCIIFHISQDQVNEICKYTGIDSKTAEEYEICEALDKIIDNLNK